jgi:hypothetical protein
LENGPVRQLRRWDLAVLGLQTRQRPTPGFGSTDGVLLVAADGSTDGPLLLVAGGGSIRGVLVEVDGSIGGNLGQWINLCVPGSPYSAKHTAVSFG